MQNQESKFRIVIVGVSLLLASPVHAFNIGNMMNPSKWMGGNSDRDRYDDYYGGPGYGYGGPGYGYGPYGYGGPGYGYGGPGYGGYGYGAPGYGGYGAPGYGYGGPGYGGYGYGAPGYGGVTEYGTSGTTSNQAEVDRLKERLRQLEGVVK